MILLLGMVHYSTMKCYFDFSSEAICTEVPEAGWPQTWDTEGFLGTWKTRGISVQPQGKTVTNKVVLVRHLDICVKQLLVG